MNHTQGQIKVQAECLFLLHTISHFQARKLLMCPKRQKGKEAVLSANMPITKQQLSHSHTQAKASSQQNKQLFLFKMYCFQVCTTSISSSDALTNLEINNKCLI